MHTGSGSDEEGDDVEDGQPIRCGRAIATDDEWCSWLREDLQSCPAWQTHSAILDECATIATGWRARFWAVLRKVCQWFWTWGLNKLLANSIF